MYEEILINIRKSFSFLRDEYGFKLIGFMLRSGFRDAGYYVQLKNEWCLVSFLAESLYLEDMGVVPNGITGSGEFVSQWAILSTGQSEKPLIAPYTAENAFNNFAEFAYPYLIDMLELAKTPLLFKKYLNEIKTGFGQRQITIDMIRAERARLHSLGLDSSLGAVMENLRKRGKDE